MPKQRSIFLILLALLTGCAGTNHEETATQNGALIGGVTGAVIGERNNNPLGGAIIGATAGAIAGNMVGESMDRTDAAYEEKFRQDQEILRRQAAQRNANAVTVDQLLKLSQAGVSDEVIVAQIQSQGVAQQLSTDDIIHLSQQNVSPAVIKGYQDVAMRSPTTETTSTRFSRSAEGPIVVERHYHHPRYYPPTPVVPRTGGFFIGVGN